MKRRQSKLVRYKVNHTDPSPSVRIPWCMNVCVSVRVYKSECVSLSTFSWVNARVFVSEWVCMHEIERWGIEERYVGGKA